MVSIKKSVQTVAFVVYVLTISSAFSQSTPPLQKPIEKPPIDQMSESGRIQEKIDERRNRQNSPDSEMNQINLNPDKKPPKTHQNPNTPSESR